VLVRKHLIFLATPLQIATGEHLPGIGPAMAGKMHKDANVKNAKQLMDSICCEAAYTRMLDSSCVDANSMRCSRASVFPSVFAAD
jgi:hypothetical protein